jgi:hypothetical protein
VLVSNLCHSVMDCCGLWCNNATGVLVKLLLLLNNVNDSEIPNPQVVSSILTGGTKENKRLGESA